MACSAKQGSRQHKRSGKNGKSAALLCLAILISSVYLSAASGYLIKRSLEETASGTIFLYVSAIFALLAWAEFIWRATLVLLYKPMPGCEDALLPACTVVVPAFNEGKQVFATLQSLAASDYPKEKLNIVAVDDGSVDDTWQWIEKGREVLGGQVTTIRQPCNRGKRHALHAGFRRSTGEVLVTVDSDSIVEPETIRNLVTPLVLDQQVGAVAGNVRVLNRDKGIIPRMLDVIFVYSFDFIRASQSRVKTVLCTPGALSAYRRSVVMNVLPEWLHQTFLGQPANIGEDRAMTNLILRDGHHVIFQRNSIVYTDVPTRHSQLCKMYLRWARSDVRETLAMSCFIFKRFRAGSRLGARINFISNLAAITKAPIFLAIVWGLLIWYPVIFGMNTVLGLILLASLAAVIYAWKFETFSALWAFVYGVYFFLALFWIRPYALLTPHKAGWLTRQIKAHPAGRPLKRPVSRNQIALQELGAAD